MRWCVNTGSSDADGTCISAVVGGRRGTDLGASERRVAEPRQTCASKRARNTHVSSSGPGSARSQPPSPASASSYNTTTAPLLRRYTQLHPTPILHTYSYSYSYTTLQEYSRIETRRNYIYFLHSYHFLYTTYNMNSKTKKACLCCDLQCGFYA